MGKGFAFLPRGIYVKSFEEDEEAQNIEQLLVQLGILYVETNNWWVQYEPTVIRDSNLDDFEFGHLLIVGKELTRRFAISLDLRALPDLDLPIDSAIASGASYRASLKLKWVVAFLGLDNLIAHLEDEKTFGRETYYGLIKISYFNLSRFLRLLAVSEINVDSPIM